MNVYALITIRKATDIKKGVYVRHTHTHTHKDIADMLVKDIKIQLVNFICLQKPQRCVEGGVGLIKFHK